MTSSLIGTDALKKINQAKVDLMSDDNTTFFSSLLSFKKLVEDPGCGTAWTDSINIGYDPEFIAKCTVEETLGVLLHELGHIIYEHIDICRDLDLRADVHNIAGDHYINLWLRNLRYKLPSFLDLHEDPKYIGWGTQQIYDELMRNPPPPKPNGLGLDCRQPKGKSPRDVQERVKGDLAKAVLQAEMNNDYGSVPGAIKRVVEDFISPRLPWNQILQNFLSAYNRADYTYRRPNKRFQPEFYMPSMYSESMGHMIAAGDCSGSITPDQWNEIIAEIRWGKSILNPTTLRLISFDTHIHHNKIYEEYDELPNVFRKGGGGTNVKPILQYVREEDPVVTLIFTDGYFSMPDVSEITNDIFWIISKNRNFDPPHGTVIHLE